MFNLLFLKEMIEANLAKVLDSLKLKSPLVYTIVIFIGAGGLVYLNQWSGNCTETYCKVLNYVGVVLLGLLGVRTTKILEEAKSTQK